MQHYIKKKHKNRKTLNKLKKAMQHYLKKNIKIEKIFVYKKSIEILKINSKKIILNKNI